MPSLAPQDAELFAKLTSVAIDSLWGILDKLGYADTFIEGVKPVHRDLDRKMVGRAITLRYLPMRKDFAETVAAQQQHAAGIRAAEEATPGSVVVFDTGRETGAGTWGDVIATRFLMAGGAGVVTDGALRDLVQIRAMDLAVYVGDMHAAASPRRLVAVDYNVPIRCGGVTVLPGDILVGDAEGVIVVPAHLAADVAERAVATEEKENYIRGKLLKGASIYGNYPPNDSITREFEEWKKANRS